jgi:hypothetical protein
MVADRIDPETMRRIEEAVRELAEMEYPKVWVGEVGTSIEEATAIEEHNRYAAERSWRDMTAEERWGMWLNSEAGSERFVEYHQERVHGGGGPTPEELAAFSVSWEDTPEEFKEGIREWMDRPYPGEMNRVEGDISITFEQPVVSEDWVDGLSVYESGLHRHIDPHVKAELSEAVRVIYHAKHGRVPVVESWDIEFKELDELDIEGGDIGVAKAFTPDGKVLVPMTPNYRYVRMEDLTSEDVDDALLDYLECYSMDGPYAMGLFVIEDTPEAQAAVERRLEGP